MFSKNNSQLAEWIPYVLVEEKKKMWSKMKDQDVFLIFDGTTREGEAFVIIARYVDEHFAVHQCLLRFLTVKQSLEGSQITMVVIQTLIEASIPIPKVLGSNRDGASVNVKDTSMRVSHTTSSSSGSKCCAPIRPRPSGSRSLDAPW